MLMGHYHIQRNETAQNLIRMVQMTLTELVQFQEKNIVTKQSNKMNNQNTKSNRQDYNMK